MKTFAHDPGTTRVVAHARPHLIVIAALFVACGDSGADATTTTTTSNGGGGGTSSTTTAGGGGATSSNGGGGAATTTSSTGGGGATGAGGMSPAPVRLVAGNVSSGSGQSYNLGHGIRILKGTRGDVFMVQEFNYGANDAAALQSFADQICGTECTAVRGPTEQIPNGVISRYPILDSGSVTDPYVTNRNFVWAHIDVPGPTDLYAFSVHLLTSSATQRQNEAVALNAAIGDVVMDPDAFIVVGGDLNTENRTENALLTLADNFVIGSPWPIDQDLNDFTNAPRNKPFDWVLVNPALDALAVPTVIGANGFPGGLVVDTRVYDPISDLSPALATDSAANSMQHMAIVKDFQLE